jgi:sugar phosphate permease
MRRHAVKFTPLNRIPLLAPARGTRHSARHRRVPLPAGETPSMQDTTPPSARYAWYLLAVLCVAYTLSFVDRVIFALLVEPIKRDLTISDTQISLLRGLAFAIFYTTLDVPIARLADRADRRRLVAAGVAFWSAMTALCGFAQASGSCSSHASA